MSGRQRVQLFGAAIKNLPRHIPINVIMLPLEGDPMAPGEFWKLAQATGGTYVSPSMDWFGAGFRRGDNTTREIAADSDYVVFVIDTSGSMFLNPGVWPGVTKKLNETLAIYHDLKGIQVMSDQGEFMFPALGSHWIADSPEDRLAILNGNARTAVSQQRDVRRFEQRLKLFGK